MTKLEYIEKAVKQLSADEVALFRLWFDEYEADLFDARIEADLNAGTLGSHFDSALAARSAGKTKKLPCGEG